MGNIRKFRIGMDIGTCQTKICIKDLDGFSKTEFLKWRHDGELLFQIPSEVHLMKNGSFNYGFSPANNSLVNKTYRYFKIDAALDQEFFSNSYSEDIDDKVNLKPGYDEFNPEFIMVLYITFIILKVESILGEQLQGVAPELTGGFLDELVDVIGGSQVETQVNMGVPTEYSSNNNIDRRKKFQGILILGRKLAQHYGNIDAFSSKNKEEIRVDFLQILHRYVDQWEKEKSLELYMNRLNLCLIPETTAGLAFLVEMNRLDSGFYAVLDIGAGSTEVSFFDVTKNNTINYRSSASILQSANRFYEIYYGAPLNSEGLKNIEERIRQQMHEGGWETEDTFTTASDSFYSELHRILKRIFLEKVYPTWPAYFAPLREMNNGRCFCYGGGSRIKGKLQWEPFQIHNQGTKFLPDTKMNKEDMGDYLPSQEILENGWKDEFHLLVVSLGLALIDGENLDTNWNTQKYVPGDNLPPLIQHPFNEGMYIRKDG